MSKWSSQVRYYGDKYDRYPRTLQEAFGPYATMATTPRHKPLRLRFVIAAIVAFGVALVLR